MYLGAFQTLIGKKDHALSDMYAHAKGIASALADIVMKGSIGTLNQNILAGSLALRLASASTDARATIVTATFTKNLMTLLANASFWSVLQPDLATSYMALATLLRELSASHKHENELLTDRLIELCLRVERKERLSLLTELNTWLSASQEFNVALFKGTARRYPIVVFCVIMLFVRSFA